VSEAQTREQDSVALLFDAEAGAAEGACTELSADDRPQALAANDVACLASHADSGRPARGVMADDRNLVETSSDSGV
jgi:hypothetical protein